MAHTDRHPVDVPGCFGCKVKNVGYDGKHLTRTTIERNPTENAKIVDHRSGRRDVEIHPRTIRMKTLVTES